MNTSQLPYFIKIANCGNLSEAARQLGVSQQALSHYLAQLEQQYGLQMFIRKKKRLILTAAGTRYLEAAREILDVVQRTQTSIQLLNSTPLHQLQIGLTAHSGALLLSKCMAEFRRAFPQIELQPFFADTSLSLREPVRSGKTEIALSNLDGVTQGGLKEIVLAKNELVVRLPQYHPLSRPGLPFDDLPEVDIEELKDEVFVLPTQKLSIFQTVQQIFEESGFRPTVAFSSPNPVFLRALIRIGYGIGITNYEPDPELAFLRLRKKYYTTVSIVSKEEYQLSKDERYLTYLFYKHLPGEKQFVDDSLLPILTEFEEMEAMG